MAEKLQQKLACDTCGTSDVKVMIGEATEDGWVTLVFTCSFGHRTLLRAERG